MPAVAIVMMQARTAYDRADAAADDRADRAGHDGTRARADRGTRPGTLIRTRGDRKSRHRRQRRCNTYNINLAHDESSSTRRSVCAASRKKTKKTEKCSTRLATSFFDS
jgi:hypothetical protein